ncbi:HdaA/DnaA family protein [Roseomonas marmotae]|uniref:Chromosomal replication initiator DnaA n=1 Tax=Roseomonas marmotae TaxID=2768161 RepID=A0ABS3KIX6_9PROT|nr:chromosomal replication initiator DnaA [Roseomonas marmotae]MBO1076578.1 chromosomal replication initiator DnaA [Roseomonas marmotae]QTI79564.1 chromosomal replication initiator DnaA [Roseomonas marmotae]
MEPQRQLALPLDLPQSFSGEVLPDSSNAEAMAWLERTESWPSQRLALFGPPGVGKSHLLRQVAARRGWRVLQGPALRGVPEPAPSVLDDADCVVEEAALFHLINACADAGLPLLLAGRAPPARWPVALPDLASRLRATTAVGITEPSDRLLATLLARDFSERQLRVPEAVQEWLLARLPREAAALAEAVARLDRAALAAGGAVTRGLARAALADWPGFGADTPALHDVSGSEPAVLSTGTPALL